MGVSGGRDQSNRAYGVILGTLSPVLLQNSYFHQQRRFILFALKGDHVCESTVCTAKGSTNSNHYDLIIISLTKSLSTKEKHWE